MIKRIKGYVRWYLLGIALMLMTLLADAAEVFARDNIERDNIKKEIVSTSEQISMFLQDGLKSDSVMLYFSTAACKDCAKVKEIIQQIGQSVLLQDGRNSNVRILELNIAEESNVSFLWNLFELYRVPQEEQQVPILFYGNGFLSGVSKIEQELMGLLQAGMLTNEKKSKWIEVCSLQATDPDAMKQSTGLSGKLALAATGFINGLNPCGISMLFMLLAVPLMMKSGSRKIGLIYLAGKYIAYFAMGLGLYHIFLRFDQSFFASAGRIMNCILGIIFTSLGVMYLIDFRNVRRKEYGKVRMQLPSALRKWNHGKIERLAKVSKRKLLLSVFVLGIVISAGEFFCTGQVYLAAILYLMRENAGNADTILSFVIYITAMCIPSLILVEVVARTGNVIRASNQSLAWMPISKLLTAVFFLIAAAAMLLM